MVSTLEAIVHRDALSTGLICNVLRGFLNDGVSLHRLRKTSRTAKEFVDGDPGMLFGKLFVRMPFKPGDHISALDTISCHCTHLIVQVGKPSGKHGSTIPVFSGLRQRWANLKPSTRPMTSKMEPQNAVAHTTERRVWINILRQCHRLSHLCVRVLDNTTSSFETLLTLRLSLEASQVSTLHSLSLTPIHSNDILPLRWSPFGAFESSPSPQVSRQLWLSITTLDILLYKPESGLSFTQSVMRTKILQTYLRSFSKTVRILKFRWLGGEGPCPLLLDKEPGMGMQDPLVCSVLEEVWLGGVGVVVKSAMDRMRERAPSCRVVKLLRSRRIFQDLENFEDSEKDDAWVELDAGVCAEWSGGADTPASSIYSQSDVEEGSGGGSGGFDGRV